MACHRGFLSVSAQFFAASVAASFPGMWIAMTVAMMLPSLVPMLLRYRQAVDGTGQTRLGWPTALVGTGYFLVWAVLGLAVFPLGVVLATVGMREPSLARAVPIAMAVVVLTAGSLQFTSWTSPGAAIREPAHLCS